MSTAFSITGFRFSFDEDTNTITSVTGPVVLRVAFNEAAPIISYTEIAPPDGEPGILRDIEIGGSERTSVTINGAALGQDADTSVGRLSWSAGGTSGVTDILNFFVSEDEQYSFVVGGDPLPESLDAALFNEILMSAVANNGGLASLPFPLPPSDSDFPPSVDLPLIGQPRWTQEAVSGPVALTLTGISFDPEGFDSGEGIDLQETQLSFAFPSDDVTLSYTQVGLVEDEDNEFDGDGLALVEFDFSAPPLGLAFGGLQRAFGDGDYSLEMGRFTTTAGTHDILLIDDNETGRQYLFQLGGVPLNFTSQADFEAFFGTVISLDPIPDGTPLGQGQTIVPGDLPGATTTPLVPYTLAGYQVGYNPIISPDDALSIAPAEMTILAPEGGFISYTEIGPMPAEYDGVQVALSSPGVFFVEVPGLSAPLSLLTQVVRLTDTSGVTYDILEFLNPTGGSSSLDFFFQIGGPELSFANLAEFNAFRETIDDAGPIPPGDPLAPDTLIPLTGLGFAPGDAPTPPEPATGTGDPAIIQFSGYRIDEDGDDNLLGFEGAQLTLALSADDNVYSYVLAPDPGDDGPDPVDITGPNPYAFLIDGVAPFGDPVIGIERITVEGVDYDVILVRLGDSNTTYVFQLDGPTPLPFTDFAAVQNFIVAADAPGAFGPIPAGSPFAPGNDFSFLNSPYATASTDPAFIWGGDEYRTAPGYGLGDGAGLQGSLTVVNGQVLTLDAGAAGEGPFLNVGRGAGAIGTVTVAGPDSVLELVGGGSPTNGVDVSIGANGGIGAMRLVDGGRFEMRDPTGPDGSDATGGGESVNIGRGAGSQGELDIYGGAFVVQGSGTSVSVGREAGEAVVFVENGGIFRMETTSADETDFTSLRVGRDGGEGMSASTVGTRSFRLVRIRTARSTSGAAVMAP